MQTKLKRAIAILYYILFAVTPLILYPYTSELFEFNKMVFVYLLSTLIISCWLMEMILEKRFIFKHTPLDYLLIIFLATQFLSTLISIDPRTSVFGYYSRFHGGLFSSIAYSLLYWAYVSNIQKENALRSIHSLFISAALVSVYAVLQHFGIDKHIWVQDVQNRVFSTLGQPNWLAAWITAIIPLITAFSLNGIQKRRKENKVLSYLPFFLNFLFFTTLLYTKSRSGMLGFLISNTIFWSFLIVLNIQQKTKFKYLLGKFFIFHFSFSILVVTIGTPWTPSLSQFLNKNPQPITYNSQPATAPALEVGGSKSEEIRKIVWSGALEIWKNYPVLGSGVETFAFSYYKFRPASHNLVSEWDFLYNKAHNEYLNFLATTGSVGAASYLLLIMGIIYLFGKNIFALNFVNRSQNTINKIVRAKSQSFNDTDETNRYLNIALLSGFISILVTNFFGFSVVPVALQFFLYPAIALSNEKQNSKKNNQINKLAYSSNLTNQKIILIIPILLATCYISFAIYRYWLADLSYSKGKIASDSSDNLKAKEYLSKAVKISPNESLYWDELSEADYNLAANLFEKGNKDESASYAKQAIIKSDKAIELSSANVNLKRYKASRLIKLSFLNPDLLVIARETLQDAVKLAPTDAKLFYNLALSHLRTGNPQEAVELLKKTIELKADYKEAYYALGLIYIDLGETDLASHQFNYILENIDPNDKNVQRELNEIDQ